jgi:hypothetical protein
VGGESRSISQLLVGAEMMGRYNGAARLLSWGVLSLGALVAGGLAQWLGVHLAFGVFAVATLAGGVHGSSKAAR